jgi:nucleotide-binding universal stress UspA family protein
LSPFRYIFITNAVIHIWKNVVDTEEIGMSDSGRPKTKPLVLNDFALNLEIARRIPSDLAFRFHTLPVGEAYGSITVAMADPTDLAARDAVTSALGKTPYFVQGSSEAIDALISEVWQEQPRHDLDILVLSQKGAPIDIQSYGTKLGDLLHARVVDVWEVSSRGDLKTHLDDQGAHAYALILYNAPERIFRSNLPSRLFYTKCLDRLPNSCLLARKPRWPIQKILLILHEERNDLATIDWSIRIAQSCGAHVTILTIVPRAPSMYQAIETSNLNLRDILAANSALGQHLRRTANRLDSMYIDSTLKLRQGSPKWEIRDEIMGSNYDLVTIAASHGPRIQRCFLGDILDPLLRWVDRPVLVAKSLQAIKDL